jgi:phosphoribosyl 1,2-cyclic phosphate phosphodiesterase
MIQLEFIGTGDCAGIPVYGCTCRICRESIDTLELRRYSSCALVSSARQKILIDAGVPDIHHRFPPHSLDRIILSHFHVDHVSGLFPMRWGYSEPQLSVHGPHDLNGCADLLKHHGIFDFSDCLEPFVARTFSDIEITPLPLNHSKPSLGYAISSGNSRLAWLCDTGGLPSETLQFLKAWQPSVMVVDCTFPPLPEPHSNHNDIIMALSLHNEIAPGRTYLTHINHHLDLWFLTERTEMPANVISARDGLVVTI